MRLVATMLSWLVATFALAVAVPACWAQQNLISADGYAQLARSAASDPVLQSAVASELATRVAPRVSVSENRIRPVAEAYTRSSSFPDQFVTVSQAAHRWLFTDSARQTDEGWQVDLGPMLADTPLARALSDRGVDVPSSVIVPVTGETANAVRPGQLRPLATWGPWVSIAAVVVTAVFALLTLAVARRRGKALAALGVSALVVGGGGWAALEMGRRYIDNALNQTTGNVRTIADVMVANAEAGLHHWLNLTLAAGGALVVFGVIVAMLGALRKKPPRLSATGTRTSAQT